MTIRAFYGFAGAASLLLGDWLGWSHVGLFERDAWCRALLAHRYPDVPQHVEAEAVPWEDYRGRFDLFAGGWPCQPHSLAGKRLADADERDGFRHVVAALRGTGAGLALLENVAGVLSSDGGRYFAGCLADLDDLGLDAQWLVLPASAAGAPHRRERLVLLAYARGRESERAGVDSGVAGAARGERGEGLQRERSGHAAGNRGSSVADAERTERALAGRADRGAPERGEGADQIAGSGRLADANGSGSEVSRSVRQRRSHPLHGGGPFGRWRPQSGVGRGADGLAEGLDWPAARGDWPSAPGQAPREWEPPRTCRSFPGRTDAIRALGNGWVIPQMALAWRELTARAGIAA